MAYGKCLKCITAYINSFCSLSLAWVLSWFNSNTSLLRNLFCISYAATVSCIFSHSTDAVEIWFGDSICSSTTCLLKLKKKHIFVYQQGQNFIQRTRSAIDYPICYLDGVISAPDWCPFGLVWVPTATYSRNIIFSESKDTPLLLFTVWNFLAAV